MSDGRDLPGFSKKSFVLPFNGGEIWFEHLDGIYGYSELVIEKLKNDIPVFTRPSKPSNIGFVLDETDITSEIIDEICNSILLHNKIFLRVAFIGADGKTKKNLKNKLVGNGFAVGFFEDFEKAKEWLIIE